MKNDLVKYAATFFYLGYCPVAAGSIATLIGGLGSGILFFHPWAWAVLFAVVTMVGFLTSGRMENLAGEKDPRCIVIDEVSGALIAFFMLPMTWSVFWTTFFVFRAFDMCKIYPANILEKRKGSVGVMMDDVVAGIYTNVIMQITVRVADWVKLNHF